MKEARLTLLIGQYSQKYYLEEKFNPSVTENIKNSKTFLPDYLPLVHPSPCCLNSYNIYRFDMVSEYRSRGIQK